MINRRHFCAAPWSGVSVDPRGYAKVCCVSHERIPFSDIESCQSSREFEAIRSQVIDDLAQPNCSECWQQEALATAGEWNSRRSMYQPGDFFHDLSDAKTNRLEHLDLRWSNTCNLTCVYCSPTYSSKWMDLLGRRQSNRIHTQLSDQKISELKFVQLAGGEPLLIKENQAFLERLLDLNPAVDIEVTSNLTQIDDNRIFDTLVRFDRVTVVASFESKDKKFEYIRRGAEWTRFARNLELCAAKVSKLQANMVFFPLSATSIVDAVHFALRFMPGDNIFIRQQIGGQGFDGLGIKALQCIKQDLVSRSGELDGSVRQQLDDQIRRIGPTQRTNTRLLYYEEFDRLTGLDHRTVFPELYQ